MILAGSTRKRVGLAFALAGILAVTPSLPLRAAGPDYLIKVWDTEDNLPNISVTAVAQTPDGYLWVGTYNGLARFDGVRFETFDPVNTPALGHARVEDLEVDSLGRLWINTYRGGLTSYHNGVFQHEWEGETEFDVKMTLVSSDAHTLIFASPFGDILRREEPATPGGPASWKVFSPPSGTRLALEGQDHEGVIWFLSRDGAIWRMINWQFEELPHPRGLENQKCFTLAADGQGRVWAGTDHGLFSWDGARFQDQTPTNSAQPLDVRLIYPTRNQSFWVLANGQLRKWAGGQWVSEVAAWRGLLGNAGYKPMGTHTDREGGIWFNHYGNGLFHITPDEKFQRLTTADGLPGDRIGCWFEDREGGIWVGVDRGGLARLRERRFQVLGTEQGLPARAAFSICEDQDGGMWFGTSGGGLCRWRDGMAESFPVESDASGNFAFSLLSRGDQGLWLSASSGEDLRVFRNGHLERPPWDVHGVKALVADHAGRVWIGTKTGVSWWSPEGHGSFGPHNGMSASAVRALAVGPDGAVWCGADDGALYRCTTNQVTAFRPEGRLKGQPIWSLVADQDGTIWAGTFRGGLLRFKDGNFSRITEEQGLPSDVICGILDDGHDQLWLGTYRGICRVSKASLEACVKGRHHVDCVTYGKLDGLPTLECAGNYQPSCCRSRDGRLWFATVKGVVSVDPREVRVKAVPPPVVIEELRADGAHIALQAGSGIVPPGAQQIEVQYTALSFLAPDSVRFRYRLEPLDQDWIEAGTGRVAAYSHVPAGDYRFHVIACNNDGVWNETGAGIAFSVQQHFYETRMFVALVASGLLAGLVLIVRRVATRKYRLALARLEQQHAIERDRARIAKDIHDDLGAGLTQITLLTELARREPAEQSRVHLERISDSARRLTRAMDEIVWAVDPQHDTLSGVLDYISAYAEDFLRTAGIRCRMDLPAEYPARSVDAESRYHLFLAVKETLNNIVKHSQATEVWIRLRLEPVELTLTIEDNGQGMAVVPARANGERLSAGNGLPNLEQRLAGIGGRCSVNSGPGTGTRVELTVRLTAAASPIVATDEPGRITHYSRERTS